MSRFVSAARTASIALWALGLSANVGLGADKQIAPAIAEEAYQRPVVIRVRGVITYATEQFLRRQLETARDRKADLIIVDIESPGGEAQASIDIAKAFAGIPWARTVAYIEDRAISGAAFVALGCDEIVMRPHALIGDAGPIVLGEDSLFRHAPEKIVSMLSAEIRTIAGLKGHPPAVAEAMVDRNIVVFLYRNAKTGATRAMSQEEAQALDDKTDWTKVGPLPGWRKDQFLTLNGADALAAGLAVANVESFRQLKDRYHVTTEPEVFEETWVDVLIVILNLPIVTGFLLVAALVCLYLELYTAGIGIFAILSGLCFTLFFWSRFLGGTAGWLEVVLFLAGVACLAVELFVLPGFGVFGLSGILLMLGGLVLAGAPMQGQFVDRFESVAKSGVTVVGAMAAFLVISLVLARYLGAIPLFRRMTLAPSSGADGAEEPSWSDSSTSLAGLVGAVGTTRTPLRPAGKMRAGERDYDVVAEGAFIEVGKSVRVVLVQGNRIVVREVE